MHLILLLVLAPLASITTAAWDLNQRIIGYKDVIGFDYFTSSSQANKLAIKHHHSQLIEGFYFLKGAYNHWTGNDTGRLCTQDDFTLLPKPFSHTYQTEADDSQAHGVPRTTPPYDIKPENLSDDKAAQFVKDGQAKYGIQWEFDNNRALGFINGTTPDGSQNWHVSGASQFLPGTNEAYYIARNQGPKHLYKKLNYVIQPLAPGAETQKAGTIATITMPKQEKPGEGMEFSVNQVFQVIQGQLSISIDGTDYNLIDKDSVVIPADTPFRIWSGIQFTKFLATSGSENGLSSFLINDSNEWHSAIWPATY
ncbi:unnamed protein product [Clonostachys rosea]|uniref:Cupin 2 conserved barrel domain-containing protein n=1 Tax=Bionectria ochroleuca TaxID=29856 RepID=A0ABY6V4P2_BIOOC|nr:unnamed protein product [Clonostachys rosea]